MYPDNLLEKLKTNDRFVIYYPGYFNAPEFNYSLNVTDRIKFYQDYPFYSSLLKTFFHILYWWNRNNENEQIKTKPKGNLPLAFNPYLFHYFLVYNEYLCMDSRAAKEVIFEIIKSPLVADTIENRNLIQEISRLGGKKMNPKVMTSQFLKDISLEAVILDKRITKYINDFLAHQIVVQYTSDKHLDITLPVKGNIEDERAKENQKIFDDLVGIFNSTSDTLKHRAVINQMKKIGLITDDFHEMLTDCETVNVFFRPNLKAKKQQKEIYNFKELTENKTFVKLYKKKNKFNFVKWMKNRILQQLARNTQFINDSMTPQMITYAGLENRYGIPASQWMKALAPLHKVFSIMELSDSQMEELKQTQKRLRSEPWFKGGMALETRGFMPSYDYQNMQFREKDKNYRYIGFYLLGNKAVLDEILYQNVSPNKRESHYKRYGRPIRINDEGNMPRPFLYTRNGKKLHLHQMKKWERWTNPKNIRKELKQWQEKLIEKHNARTEKEIYTVTAKVRKFEKSLRESGLPSNQDYWTETLSLNEAKYTQFIHNRLDFHKPADVSGTISYNDTIVDDDEVYEATDETTTGIKIHFIKAKSYNQFKIKLQFFKTIENMVKELEQFVNLTGKDLTLIRNRNITNKVSALIEAIKTGVLRDSTIPKYKVKGSTVNLLNQASKYQSLLQTINLLKRYIKLVNDEIFILEEKYDDHEDLPKMKSYRRELATRYEWLMRKIRSHLDLNQHLPSEKVWEELLDDIDLEKKGIESLNQMMISSNEEQLDRICKVVQPLEEEVKTEIKRRIKHNRQQMSRQDKLPTKWEIVSQDLIKEEKVDIPTILSGYGYEMMKRYDDFITDLEERHKRLRYLYTGNKLLTKIDRLINSVKGTIDSGIIAEDGLDLYYLRPLMFQLKMFRNYIKWMEESLDYHNRKLIKQKEHPWFETVKEMNEEIDDHQNLIDWINDDRLMDVVDIVVVRQWSMDEFIKFNYGSMIELYKKYEMDKFSMGIENISWYVSDKLLEIKG